MTGHVVVAADHCVHTRIETASCRACVEVCPHRAWHLDDDGLNLSESDCDGCGLCVAACPTRAISAPTGKAARRRLGGHPVLMAGCERALPEGGDGRLTCLHAIPAAELLRHWRQGERVWLISTADCAGCERGRGEGFGSRVSHINSLLQARGGHRILVRPLPPAQWRRLCQLGADPSRGRRGFFERLLRRPVPALLETALQDEARPDRDPPGVCLEGPGPLPWAIRLDPLACVACHACTRVCPSQALRLEGELPGAPGRQTLRLRLEHARCTGCGLCADVCAPNAIEVKAWSRPDREEIPLRASTCRVCGVPYQLPAARRDAADTCWICARARPAARLYQVMGGEEGPTGAASA